MSTFESAVRGSVTFEFEASDLDEATATAAAKWAEFSGSSDGLPWSADISAKTGDFPGVYAFTVTVPWSRTTVTKTDA